MSPLELARKIDQTLLRPDADLKMMDKFCKDAIEYHFASVCILPYYTKYAAELLHDTDVKVCTVVGFPLGATFRSAKQYEADAAILGGAGEIDMVMNIAAFKSGRREEALHDMENITRLAGRSEVITKVIIETALLTKEEKIDVCKIVTDSGADFIKTSTGFAKGGATIEDIMLLKENTGENVKVKASGGIKTAKFALELIKAGADRIGASAGIEIIKEAEQRQ